MFPRSRAKLSKPRAFCAAVALFLSTIAGPVALAMQGPDVCSATCCVNEGHCCCTPRHALVAGQTSGTGPSINETSLTTTCPEGCSTPARTHEQTLRFATRATGVHWTADEPIAF